MISLPKKVVEWSQRRSTKAEAFKSLHELPKAVRKQHSFYSSLKEQVCNLFEACKNHVDMIEDIEGGSVKEHGFRQGTVHNPEKVVSCIKAQLSVVEGKLKQLESTVDSWDSWKDLPGIPRGGKIYVRILLLFIFV